MGKITLSNHYVFLNWSSIGAHLVYDLSFLEGTKNVVILTEEDLLITMVQKEGFITEADNTVTVVVDTTLSEELLEEGFVYEIISKIQTMRKDADFEVMDHIKVSVLGNEKLADIVKKNESAIATKVLADSFDFSVEYAIKKEWNVNGESVTICLEK
jgi:isoleucyl-tRNA synthetase